MNYIMQQITSIGIIIIVIMSVVLFLCIVFYVLNKRKRKQRRMKEVEMDYSTFERKNAVDYLRLDDIRNNMIYTENNRRFIAAIQCHGFDFFSAHPSEQAATANSYMSFINTINQPITYRQYSSIIDLEDTQLRYQEVYQKLQKELASVKQMRKELVDMDITEFSEEEKKVYEEEQKRLEKQMKAFEFRKFHLEDQMAYMEDISGEKVMPEQNETYIVDWSFNPMDFSVDLSEEEIKERAKKELSAIARAKISALSNCGVRANRCSTEMLIDMCRRYSAPISSNRYKLKDIKKSAYFKDIITSTSIEELKEQAISVSQAESESLMQTFFEDTQQEMICYYEEQLVLLSEQAEEEEKKLREKENQKRNKIEERREE